MANQKFDIVLSDYLLKDGSAFDILEAASDTPTVVITGSGNEEVAVNAMKLGAYDYLIKDLARYYLTVLPLTVANTLTRKETEADLHRFYQELSQVREKVQAIWESAQVLQQEVAGNLKSQHQEHLAKILTCAEKLTCLIRDLVKPVTGSGRKI